ncbi:hypothetical protein ACS0TY_000943 [Phlomoides rotata]
MMRTLCTNLDREDALETVLEVPVPEETFASKRHNSWQLNIKSWLVRPTHERGSIEIQSLLGVIGAPLIPLPISSVNDHTIKGYPIERSMAKYIVQQYVAASGGEHALNKIESMCAIGKVKMASSEFVAGEGLKGVKTINMKNGPGQLGGFVLWQKGPNMWSLELMVSGFKISAGSDGKGAWRQTPWQNSHSSRGPPRPLRRSLQGLDPMSTANLFSNSICMGEKTINGEDCFVLKLEAEDSTLRARSSGKVDMIRHTLRGCFSQKTGLLVQLEDSQLLKIKSPGNEDVFWETTMESWIQDYRTIDGVNIAHGGRTNVSLFRFGQDSENNTRTRMEEVWSIEEVDFNVRGLSAESFMAPGDLKNDEEECGVVEKKGGLRYKVLGNCGRICAPKSGTRVVAVDDDNLELFVIDE